MSGKLCPFCEIKGYKIPLVNGCCPECWAYSVEKSSDTMSKKKVQEQLGE